jgi:VanZ family protein
VALADEGHQSMVATRSGALRDVGLDMASALLAAFFAFLSRNIQVVRRKPAG